MNKGKVTGLITTFIVLVLLVICCSCGPTSLLKRAERLTTRAIERGAKVETDTLWKKLQFNIKGPAIAVDLRPVFNRPPIGTMTIFKDTIIYTVPKGGSGPPVKTQFLHDTLYVDCPDSVVKASVPVAVTTEISAGFSVWELIKWCFMTAVVSVLAGRLLWR